MDCWSRAQRSLVLERTEREPLQLSEAQTNDNSLPPIQGLYIPQDFAQACVVTSEWSVSDSDRLVSLYTKNGIA